VVQTSAATAEETTSASKQLNEQTIQIKQVISELNVVINGSQQNHNGIIDI